QYVEGTIADWHEWGDDRHTLAPVQMDHPIDSGIYYDPCIWVQHPLEVAVADVFDSAFFEGMSVDQLTAKMKKSGEPLPDHLLIVDQSAAQLLNTATPKSIKQWLTRLQVFVSPLLDTTVIARKLAEVLPAHMMPSHYLLLDVLPLMPSGKIDKKALSISANNSGTKQTQNKTKYVAPSGEIQCAVADIWARMLQCERALIGANDNFFELGGHSLLSVRLASTINADWGLELKIRDIFEAPKLWQLARLVSDWVDQQHQSVKTPPIVALKNIAHKNTGELPTSYAQQQLWFIDKMAGGSADHNMAGAFKLEGQFNVIIAEQAFKRIITRHQPLRTVFKQRDEGPVQVIRPNVEFTLNRVDLTDLDETSLKQAIDEAMKADAATAFDLSHDLMLRASFLQCSENEGVLLLNIHHIAADGWSIGILLDEFVQQYQAIEAGNPDPLSPLTVQYGDFAQWQKNTLTGDYLKPKLDYWASQLADCPQVHHLPLTQSRQASRRQSSKRQSGNCQQVIDRDLCNDLNDLCHKQQTTLFMLLQSAFAVHIGRCSFETDVMMGAPVAGRTQQVLEPMIGLLLNTQVYRTRFDDNPSFETLLNRTRQDHLEAAGFGDVPFELLVDKINPERSLNHSPLFQILINMDNTEQSQASFSDLSILNKCSMTPLGDSRGLDAKYELTLYIKQSDDSLTFDWVYDSNLFNASTIAMMAREFAWLLQQFVSRPAQPVLAHSWSDSRGWLKNAHRHSTKAATQGCITELFEQQVKRVPEQIAISFLHENISYKELNQKANQLAHYLDQEWRILLNDRVAFALERGIARVVAILAVLKLGAVYVPLSAELPAKRLAGMLEDAKVHCILADTASTFNNTYNNTYNNTFNNTHNNAQTVITLDCKDVVSACAKHSTDNLIDRKINADTLAHIIY
ncbi:MAG: condensation domain-containing protein, partial [Psychrosphaera sp.]|nr:condensation domain-containing protein [Psychrosphaera sp.]